MLSADESFIQNAQNNFVVIGNTKNTVRCAASGGYPYPNILIQFMSITSIITKVSSVISGFTTASNMQFVCVLKRMSDPFYGQTGESSIDIYVNRTTPSADLYIQCTLIQGGFMLKVKGFT